MKSSPNLLKVHHAQGPEQLFVIDITYVKSEQGVHYLSLITDANSFKIIGYELSNEMKTSDIKKALTKAIANRRYQNLAIHHSDRGLQYCAYDYKETLFNNGILSSMTDSYDRYQNALIERIHEILKQEFLLYKCRDIDESIRIYNEVRPHLSLSMKTPNQVHKKIQEPKLLDFH